MSAETAAEERTSQTIDSRDFLTIFSVFSAFYCVFASVLGTNGLPDTHIHVHAQVEESRIDERSASWSLVGSLSPLFVFFPFCCCVQGSGKTYTMQGTHHALFHLML